MVSKKEKAVSRVKNLLVYEHGALKTISSTPPPPKKNTKLLSRSEVFPILGKSGKCQ